MKKKRSKKVKPRVVLSFGCYRLVKSGGSYYLEVVTGFDAMDQKTWGYVTDYAVEGDNLVFCLGETM